MKNTMHIQTFEKFFNYITPAIEKAGWRWYMERKLVLGSIEPVTTIIIHHPVIKDGKEEWKSFYIAYPS